MFTNRLLMLTRTFYTTTKVVVRVIFSYYENWDVKNVGKCIHSKCYMFFYISLQIYYMFNYSISKRGEIIAFLIFSTYIQRYSLNLVQCTYTCCLKLIIIFQTLTCCVTFYHTQHNSAITSTSLLRGYCLYRNTILSNLYSACTPIHYRL